MAKAKWKNKIYSRFPGCEQKQKTGGLYASPVFLFGPPQRLLLRFDYYFTTVPPLKFSFTTSTSPLKFPSSFSQPATFKVLPDEAHDQKSVRAKGFKPLNWETNFSFQTLKGV